MGRETFQKRQREKVRDERKAAKRERREAAKLADDADAPDAPDEAALNERFRLLSERHAAGAVSDEDYEVERREIFAALGLDAPET